MYCNNRSFTNSRRMMSRCRVIFGLILFLSTDVIRILSNPGTHLGGEGAGTLSR